MINWALMERLARAHALEDPQSSEEAGERFLRRWWAMKYNRPLKDPLLESYSADELLYEFLLHKFTEKDPRQAEKEQAEKEAAAKKEAEDIKWAIARARESVKTLMQKPPTAVPGDEQKPSETQQLPELKPISSKFEE